MSPDRANADPCPRLVSSLRYLDRAVAQIHADFLARTGQAGGLPTAPVVPDLAVGRATESPTSTIAHALRAERTAS